MLSTKLISSATSDLISDQRVHRICKTLHDQGFEVLALGRRRPGSLSMTDRPYQTHRFKLIFDKGPLFYMEYNFKLLLFLLRQKVDVLLANDLDTLPANAIASILKGIPLVYDSHEYFTEVPELVKRPLIKTVWKIMERLFIKRSSRAFTVSESIARAYNEKYELSFTTIRNLPEKLIVNEIKSDGLEDLRKNDDYKILLYQGSVNIDRGLEEMIDAMQYLPTYRLYIIGSGDILDELKRKVSELTWKDRIQFLGKISFEQLPGYTIQADLGLSIEKKNGLSYTYALPNKVFDYVQVGVPVLMSDLPELKKINDQYGIGIFIESHEPKVMARNIESLFAEPEKLERLIINCKRAAGELNWEKESKLINHVFSDFLDRG